MPRSSGKFISYDLRPAKQSERRILIDILKAGGDAGLPLADYRYVGMGANRFYDFLLIHRYLGITRMVSLEHDAKFYHRAHFNVPYKFINVENTSAGDFAVSDQSTGPSIYWLDFDGGISQQIVFDIMTYGQKAKVGDFIFVTVSGNPPRVIDKSGDAAKLAWLQDNLGDVATGLQVTDTERSTFPTAVYKILTASFKNAFSARNDGNFTPLLQVRYSDSMPMITVGGAFVASGTAVAIKDRLRKVAPFLEVGGGGTYDIRSLHLTDRERHLFDRAVTSARSNNPEANTLRKLGFGDSDFAAYRDLIRFLPRYVEAIV